MLTLIVAVIAFGAGVLADKAYPKLFPAVKAAETSVESVAQTVEKAA